MTEEKKKEIALTFIQSLQERDLEKLRSVLTDDAVWSLPGASQVSGEAIGANAIAERGQYLGEHGGNFELLHVIYGFEGMGIMLHNTAKCRNKVLDEYLSSIFRLRGDKICRIDIEDRKHAEERLQEENLVLREEIDRSSMFEEIIGSSESLRIVLAQVTKVAPTDSTVLILGETGTGKELIARAIHKRSNRSRKPFIRVNCAAIPPSLISSELFGHEKGAFTGAIQRRLGHFEAADGGTIFLDEIGELPYETQVALLRVLQEREFERVGSSQPVSVDVRVLAATNRELDAAVSAGTFRQDLFYRLNVFPVLVPSLRERKDDLPSLRRLLKDEQVKAIGTSAAGSRALQVKMPGGGGKLRIKRLHLELGVAQHAHLLLRPVVRAIGLEHAVIAALDG
jgi:transcriptional regulator of acetoin/glycerol metabolism